MSYINKMFGAGVITNANTVITMYTAPSSRISIIKSLTLCNSSSSPVTAILRLGGVEVLFNYTIKPNATIVVPVMDQCMLAGDTITLYCSNANAINYYISGIEATLTDADYSSVKRLGMGVLRSVSDIIVGTSTKDRMIKGIILCNTSTYDVAASIEFGSYKILSSYLMKSYDTILIPTMDHVLPANATVSGLGSGINYFITGTEL
ncbi:hypothetical protein ACN9MH_15440 [Paenibacillus silvae]|uniref:hypothetical protein n=1 Tax=Paenibacillus silvae TaxID=1325358 RepID=UPI003CE789DF